MLEILNPSLKNKSLVLNRYGRNNTTLALGGAAVTAINALLQELEQEAGTTRRVFECVPEAQLGWRPHPKSLTLGQLALHVATIPGVIAEMATHSPFSAAPIPRLQPSSVAELFAALDQSVTEARKILSELDENELGSTWKLIDGDQVIMAVPRGALLRTLMLNHWYHHRGQLTVYLRQVGSVVPAIYGPSTDENPFMPKQG